MKATYNKILQWLQARWLLVKILFAKVKSARSYTSAEYKQLGYYLLATGIAQLSVGHYSWAETTNGHVVQAVSRFIFEVGVAICMWNQIDNAVKCMGNPDFQLDLVLKYIKTGNSLPIFWDWIFYAVMFYYGVRFEGINHHDVFIFLLITASIDLRLRSGAKTFMLNIYKTWLEENAHASHPTS